MSAESKEAPIHYCNPNILLIKKSGIHGAGCYALATIPEGAYVVQYTGPVLSKEQADGLYCERPDTYLFCLGEGEYVIDGDNVAAFINHSCDPNCETDEVEGKVWVIALREIAPGEELTYDYNLYDGDDDDDAPCNCGAKACRKTMYGEEETERRNEASRAASTAQEAVRETAAPEQAACD
jgi:SET domain-containing protein